MADQATMTAEAGLKRTPLYELHIAQGAKMVPFAGWEMPVQYPSGILAEHRHTREKAGLFDVSHMGQVLLREAAAKAGDAPNTFVQEKLEGLVPADIIGLAENRLRYGLFTNPEGGILDDMMITNKSDHLYVVVNAACADQDIAHLHQLEAQGVTVTHVTDRGLLSLQGPRAEHALAAIIPGVEAMPYMSAKEFTWHGAVLWISRSGYTGEDGYEISIPAELTRAFAELLLNDADVALVGLGARDSLRLEAGMLLYGHDMDHTTTPSSVGLPWTIPAVRRRGGAREGGFPGADIILEELVAGARVTRRGLRPEGRAPIRDETPLFDAAEGGKQIGTVGSGGFSPSLGVPIAAASLPVEFAVGATIWAESRGRRTALQVCKTPFVPHSTKK